MTSNEVYDDLLHRINDKINVYTYQNLTFAKYSAPLSVILFPVKFRVNNFWFCCVNEPRLLPIPSAPKSEMLLNRRDKC